MRSAIAVALIALSSYPARAQRSSPVGLWSTVAPKWKDAPKDLGYRERYADATFVDLRPDGTSLYVYDTLYGSWSHGKYQRTLSGGDSWEVWRGTWHLCGDNLCLDRELVYADVHVRVNGKSPYCNDRTDHLIGTLANKSLSYVIISRDHRHTWTEVLRRDPSMRAEFDKLFAGFRGLGRTQIDEDCAREAAH